MVLPGTRLACQERGHGPAAGRRGNELVLAVRITVVEVHLHGLDMRRGTYWPQALRANTSRSLKLFFHVVYIAPFTPRTPLPVLSQLLIRWGAWS